MITSTVHPDTTRDGIGELRRRWSPGTDAWADLVIVHGIGEHSGRYERAAELLAERGIDVRSFDLVGFGATDGPRGHVDDWTTYLDQVEDNLAAARTDDRPLVLLGHSMGGLIAVEYCLSERPLPDALVASTPALTAGEPWQLAVAPVLGSLAPRLKLPTGVLGEHLSRDPAVGERYFEDPLVLTKATARLGAELFAAMARVGRHLSSLALPTLLTHGSEDPIVLPETCTDMGGLGCVEHRLYPDLRHETLNEPEGPMVVSDIADWLERTLTTG